MKGLSVLPLHRAHRRLLRHTRPSASPRRRAPFRAVHLSAVRTAGVLLAGALALAGAFTAVVTGAAPASAHAVLVKATPADGAVLRAAPTSVVLQFDDPISTSFATLTVTGPDGATVSSGRASVSGNKVSGALDDGLAPGRYRTVFRVVSEDGHPVNGQLTFTVKLPGGTGSPSTTPGAPAAGTTSGGATTSSGAASPGNPSSTPADGAPSPSGDPGASSTAAGSPAGGSSWLADNLLPLTGALLLVVIGVGALLWDRLRH